MIERKLNSSISHLFETHPYAQWYTLTANSWEKLIEMCWRKKTETKLN